MEGIIVVIEGTTVITTKAGTETKVEAAITHPDATDIAKWDIFNLNTQLYLGKIAAQSSLDL